MRNLMLIMMSHTRWVAIFFVAITTTMLSTEGYFSYQAELHKAAETADNLSLLLSERFSADIVAVETMLTNSVDTVGSNFGNETDITIGPDHKLENYLQRQLTLAPVVDNLSLSAHDGMINYVRIGAIGTRIDNLEIFNRLKYGSSLNAEFSNVYASPFTGLSVVSIARPLKQVGRSFEGIAMADLDLFYFQRLLLNVSVGKYGSLMLSHENGQLVACIPEAPGNIGHVLPLPVAVGPKLQASLGWTALGRLPSEDDLRMFSVRKLPGLPFTIAVGLSSRDFLAAWRIKVGIHGIFILCLMVLTFTLERFLVRERKQALELRETESRVEHNRRQLQIVIDAAPVALAIARMSDGAITMCNMAAANMLGHTRADANKRRLLEFCADITQVADFPKKLLEQGFLGGHEVEIRRDNGDIRWLLIDAVMIDFDSVRSVILGGNDITERKALEFKLLELAAVDSLTGLANRRAFTQRAENEYQRAIRTKRPLSVLMIDIDRFKLINDGYGHAVGDDIIRTVSGKMTEVLRVMDFAGRLGGDEFTILLPETLQDAALLVAKRLGDKVSASPLLSVTSDPITVTISIGVATLIPDDECFDQVLKRADDGLYAAKRAGRNQAMVSE